MNRQDQIELLAQELATLRQRVSMLEQQDPPEFDEYVLELHAGTHEDGGTDEIDVTGLSGDLADAQNPTAHATSHHSGGGDALALGSIAGQVATAQIADDAVDDVKAGNRVAQFYRRQGGHATTWSTQGTTDYTPTKVRLQAGVIRWTGNRSDGHVTVTFPAEFGGAPIVFAIHPTSARIFVTPDSVSTTQVILWWICLDGNNRTSLDFNWLAMGPE